MNEIQQISKICVLKIFSSLNCNKLDILKEVFDHA
mgnify:CR=1 FL=1